MAKAGGTPRSGISWVPAQGQVLLGAAPSLPIGKSPKGVSFAVAEPPLLLGSWSPLGSGRGRLENSWDICTFGWMCVCVWRGGQTMPTPGEMYMHEDLWETVPRANTLSPLPALPTLTPALPPSVLPPPPPPTLLHKRGLGHRAHSGVAKGQGDSKARVYLQDGRGARASGDSQGSELSTKPCWSVSPRA